MAAVVALGCVTWSAAHGAERAPASRLTQRHTRHATTDSHGVRITFLDVGQGDGALLESSDGHAAMIDTGPPEATAHVREVLASHHVTTLDWVMFSHPHLDHIGGGLAVFDDVHVARVIDPAYPHAIATYDRLLARIQQLGLTFTAARTGATIALGNGVRLDLLLPHEPFLDRTRSDVNANSIVARLETGHVHVLFTGDAERPTEERLLAENTTSLAADVLKVAHHGSRFASSAAFLDAVHPRFAVISCGTANGYGHPHVATLRVLANRTVAFHRTDLEGDVTLDTDGANVTLHGTRPTDDAARAIPGTPMHGAREPN